MALPTDATPGATADPSYGALIAGYIKKTFKTLPPVNTFEISQLRWVHAVAGWNWLVCVRFQERERMRTYALFIKDNAVVDGRYAVEADACNSRAYSPFDPETGVIGPSAVGAHASIY